jgi:release factor glutamine methyltransferase
LSLLHELPAATGVGVDRSRAALSVARANAAALCMAPRAAFVCSDWGSALAGGFDLIVANPPYIARRAWIELPISVRQFEPVIALDGGPDGLAAYRALLPDLPRLLAPGGGAFLELGAGQAADVMALLPDELQRMEMRNDLGGVPRALGLLRPIFLVDRKSLESKRFHTSVQGMAKVSPELAPKGAIDLPIS